MIFMSDLFDLYIYFEIAIHGTDFVTLLLLRREQRHGRDRSMNRKSSCTLCREHSVRGSRETGGRDYKLLDVFARFVSFTVVPGYSARRHKFVRVCT